MADKNALSTPTKRKKGVQPNESPKSSPASSKKAKSSKSPTNFETAGRVNDTKTYSSTIWQRKGQMAGYLGYSDIADLRRFTVCPITLRFYNSLKDDLVNVRLDSVLELIRGKSVNVLSDDNPHTKYPPEYGKMNHRVALTIAQAKCAIENAQSGSIAWTQDEVEEECAKFEALAKVRCPRLHASEFRPVFPKLGPFNDLGENDLQAFARVFSLIKYLEYSTKSPWKGRFGSKRWDQSLLVAESHVPRWMRSKPSLVAEASKPATEATVSLTDDEPARQALSVVITWNYKSKLPGASVFRQFVEKEGLLDAVQDVPKKQILRIEPAAKREHILNSVREMFRLQQLNAQIKTLTLELIDPSLPEDDEVGDPTFPVPTTLWSKIREELWSGRYDLTKSSFSMTVRTAQPGEVILDKVIPLDLGSHFTVANGDVARKEQDLAHQRCVLG